MPGYSLMAAMCLASVLATLAIVPTSAMPVSSRLNLTGDLSSDLVRVQRRPARPHVHRPGGHVHYYRPGRHRRAAIAAGVAGAVVGGAIVAGAAAQRNAAYCAQRYRSYDPGSGTYLGSDGRRRPCP